MKTIILSLLFVGSSFALFAQTDTTRRDTTRKDTTGGNTDSVNTIRSTGSYGAYGSVAVPSTVQSSFMSQFPTAGNAMWDRDTATNMWRARYNTGGRNISVFMDERGNSYSLALPIVQSLVPENVISTAVNTHGNNVYDILQLRTAADSMAIYQVRVIENGQVTSKYMKEDGTETTMVYRTDDTTSNMNNAGGNWNNTMGNTTDTTTGNLNNNNSNQNNNSGNVSDTTGSGNNLNNNTTDTSGMQNNGTNMNNNGTNNNNNTNNLNNQDQSTQPLNNTNSDQGTNNTNTNSTEGLNNSSGNNELESTNNTNNNTNTNTGTNTNTNNSTGTGSGTNTNTGTGTNPGTGTNTGTNQ
jgi:hypothetical protein